MAAIGFSDSAEDVVSFRKAIFRMILSRAKTHLTDPADIEELDISQAMEGIAFELLAGDQRTRLLDAVYEGTQDLRRQVLAGEPTEEEVRPDIEDKLDEILALLSRYR